MRPKNKQGAAWPILLLLAAMANPVIAAPRPLDALRLVASIEWLAEDREVVETPAAHRPAAPAHASVHRSPFGAPDPRARATAFSRSSFQRPPPDPALHG